MRQHYIGKPLSHFEDANGRGVKAEMVVEPRQDGDSPAISLIFQNADPNSDKEGEQLAYAELTPADRDLLIAALLEHQQQFPA